MVSHNNLITRINEIKNKIEESASKVKRNSEDITLIVVTKTQHASVWEMLLKEKLLHIGENRFQETLNNTKIFSQTDKLILHLIGHLQKNKINKAINTYDVIQTVDSIELAKKINQACQTLGKKQEIYLQVNISKDPRKHGMEPETIQNNAKNIINMKNINLTGIMTIPKQGLDKKELSLTYAKVKNIQKNIQNNINKKIKNISMGMSNDYDIAIQEGATHIRLGTAIFGKENDIHN